MSQKTLIWIGLCVGTTIGGFVPELWGGGLLSMSSFVFQAIGGLAGIWAGLKFSQVFGA